LAQQETLAVPEVAEDDDEAGVVGIQPVQRRAQQFVRLDRDPGAAVIV
jgi:hypothetical protein